MKDTQGHPVRHKNENWGTFRYQCPTFMCQRWTKQISFPPALGFGETMRLLRVFELTGTPTCFFLSPLSSRHIQEAPGSPFPLLEHYDSPFTVP